MEKKPTFISNGLDPRTEEYYLGTDEWSTNSEDWELRIGAGGIVNDPQGEWDYSTAEAYINEQMSRVVTDVNYDTSNKKITKTINNTTTDIVTLSDLVADSPVMTGATELAAGTKGLVPAPAAGDDYKFLRGDGTWTEDIPRATFVGTELVFSSGGVFSGTTLLLS